MNKEMVEVLREYIKGRVAPILMEDIYTAIIPDCMEASLQELKGSYDENGKFIPPKWYEELSSKRVLMIRNIDEYSFEEQRKAIELLKYRKIDTFSLPDSVIIIITCKTMDYNKISPDIISLTVQLV